MVRLKYKKGANAERELAKMLKEMGFGVIRAAKSGGKISTPDVVAAKKGKILAIECKTWNRKPSLKKEEMKELLEWAKRAGAQAILAWRKRGKWFFYELKKVEKIEENKFIDQKTFFSKL